MKRPQLFWRHWSGVGYFTGIVWGNQAIGLSQLKLAAVARYVMGPAPVPVIYGINQPSSSQEVAHDRREEDRELN